MNEGIDLISCANCFASCIVCLVIGVLLLSFKTPNRNNKGGYIFAKRMLASAAFLTVALCGASTWLIVNGKDFMWLDTFVIPLVYFCQLHTITYALLALIHSRKAVVSRSFLRLAPITVITVMHVVTYWVSCDGFVTYESYAMFCSLPVSAIISDLLFAALGIEFIFCCYALITGLQRYFHNIDDLFSGKIVSEMKQMVIVVYCFLVYFVVAGLDFVIGDLLHVRLVAMLDIYFVWFNILVFTMLTIVLVNMESLYFTTASAFNVEITPMGNVVDRRVKKPVEVAPQVMPRMEEQPVEVNMEEVVRTWSDKSDKPYLAESLSLADVANDMRVSAQELSQFLNKVCGQNFNTWINTLRVEEAKRLLMINPSLSMTEVAGQSGFADASVLSRTFKRLTGETPTGFKNRRSKY